MQTPRTRQFDQAWLRSDETAASTWVRDLPPGSARDSAAIEVLNSLIADKIVDYEAAFAWAETIESNQSSADDVWKRWLQDDTASARAAMEGAGMEAAKIEELQKRAENESPNRRN